MQVVVTAAGADGAQRGGAVEVERLIHGTGVVIKTTGDFQIGDHGSLGRMRAASSTIIASVSSPWRANT